MTLNKLLRTGAAAVGMLAVASAGQANAADIYSSGGLKDVPAYVPPPVWTGFYLGGHMGAAWANIDLNRWSWEDEWGVHTLGGNNLSTTGAFGGGQFGYNFQTANFVYGIEVDLGAMIAKDRNHFWAGGVAFDPQMNGGFYGDVTGRLGMTWGPALIYAKGGFAFLNEDFQGRMRFWGDPFNHDNSNTITGWTVGGGLEWKVAPNWSFKAEYLHFDFSNNDNNNWCMSSYWCGSTVWRNNNDLTVDTVKLGVNYFWNAPYAPLK